MESGKFGLSVEYEPVVEPVAPISVAPENLDETNEQDLSLAEKRKIVDEVVRIGVLFRLGSGQAPTLKVLESINALDPTLLPYNPSVYLNILATGQEVSQELTDELERDLQAWVEFDAAQEIEELEAEKQYWLEEIDRVGLNPDYEKVKINIGNKAKPKFVLSEEHVPDDELIFRYHRYRFAKEFLRSKDHDEEQLERTIFRAVMGFNHNGNGASSLYGELAKATASHDQQNDAFREIKVLSQSAEWHDFLYPEVRDDFLAYVAWAGDFKQREARKEKREEKIAIAADYYQAKGDFPTSIMFRKREIPGLGPATIADYFGRSTYIFREQTLLEVNRRLGVQQTDLRVAA